MKQTLLIIFFLLSMPIFSQQNDLYTNYLTAARNYSTTQLFLVITFKDLNNNEIREVCVEGNQLLGAITNENNFDYSDESLEKVDLIIQNNKNRYFEFKNSKAIKILQVPYSKSEFDTFKSQIDFKRLAKKVSKNPKWKKILDFKEMIMYAHALFNQGVLTYTNGCIGDDTLRILDKKNPF